MVDGRGYEKQKTCAVILAGATRARCVPKSGGWAVITNALHVGSLRRYVRPCLSPAGMLGDTAIANRNAAHRTKN